MVGGQEGKAHQEWDFRLGLVDNMENYTQNYSQRGEVEKFYYPWGLKLHSIKEQRKITQRLILSWSGMVQISFS